MLTATVIVPTTSDRGPLLPLSVGSALRQTVADLEVFIIGDGVTPETRRVAAQLQAQDSRVRFFDFGKHPRRGEAYRHEALAQARGRIITYLCDRDLYLPTHVEALARQLATADVAATNFYYVRRDGRLFVPYLPPQPERAVVSILSAVGHTRAFYERLPRGWHTTPAGQYTDRYMWRHLLAQPGCRAAMHWLPTLLYFPRNGHPGWPTAQRLAELTQWVARSEDPAQWRTLEQEALGRLIRERNYLRAGLLSVKGRRLPELPAELWQRLKQWLRSAPPDGASETDWPAPIKSDR